MNIKKTAKFSLAEFPTPVHHLKTFSERFEGLEVFMKRDDLTSLGMGGNKTRKLEFLVGQALEQGKDTLVTAGGLQSNHCRLTAAAARRAGLSCHLVLNGDEPRVPNGNLLLDRLLGAKIHYCQRKDRDECLHRVGQDLSEAGRHPYIIPVGGSNSVGSTGYVHAMMELMEQLDRDKILLDAIVFASSSGGTQAGLTLGARAAGFKGRVLGISIDQVKTGKGAFPPVLARIANETAQRLDLPIRLKEDDFDLDCSFLGTGYAMPESLEFEAIKTLAMDEGIILGPVYTARAMGAMMDLMAKGIFPKGQNILFWHTGGAPEVFAWAGWFKTGFLGGADSL